MKFISTCATYGVIIKLNLNIPSNEPQKNPRLSFLIWQIALAIRANIKRKKTIYYTLGDYHGPSHPWSCQTHKKKMLGKPPCNLHENNLQNNMALHIKQGHAYSHFFRSKLPYTILYGFNMVKSWNKPANTH